MKFWVNVPGLIQNCNCGLYSSLEITFSPKDFNTTLDDQKFSLPISLDQPCNPLIKDCPIEFLD